MSLFSKKQTGDAGEQYTADFLKKHGYKIVERNFRTRFGEIDIIAENKSFLVFVEVKTRHENPYTAPMLAVDRRKREKLITTALQYCAIHREDRFTRFDVSEVYIDSETLKLIKINYIENAFDASR